MSKVISTLGQVVDFGKLKIQHELEESKNNPPVVVKAEGRVSTLDPNKLGMGIKPNLKEGLVSLASDATDPTDIITSKSKKV
jgi:hypothetical protein